MESYIEYQKQNSEYSAYHDIRYYRLYSYQFQYHFHKAHEMIFVLDGEIELVVDGKASRMVAGNIALIASNQIHSFSTTPETAFAELLIHVVSMDVVSRFTQALGKRVGDGAVLQPNPSTWTFLVQNYLLPMKRQVEEQLAESNGQLGVQELFDQSWAVREDGRQLAYLPYLYTVCALYLETKQLVSAHRETNHIVGKLLTYVDEHFTENISLESAAALLGYESHYLSRCLNRFIQISFKQFLNEYRVNHAKKLLAEKSMSVTAVAYASGFQSIRNFNRVFNEVGGMTPTSYRRTYGDSV